MFKIAKRTKEKSKEMSDKIKDLVGEYMDKLIKEHGRELIIGLLKQYGVTIVLAQVISILRSTKDEGLMALSKDLEIALDNHESKNEKKQIGKKVGFVPTSDAEKASSSEEEKKDAKKKETSLWDRLLSSSKVRG